ncbi:MAG TPA: hypothetical protein VM409_00780 [Chloroflexia bacterium]|nr:hypothetical protein [Chloroflexia bacterium]
MGSDSFVLSNYSFQQGTTYYVDLDGNGVRNIVQLHYITDRKSLEFVVHQASREAMQDHTLLTLPLP